MFRNVGNQLIQKNESLNNIPHRRRKARRRITNQTKEKKIFEEENLNFQPSVEICICLYIFAKFNVGQKTA